MEPVSAIVGALSAGAAALASGALKDAYKRLRGAILRVVSPADLEKLEQKPNSENRKGVLAEELAEAGKAGDTELAELAREHVERDLGFVFHTINDAPYWDETACYVSPDRRTRGGDRRARGDGARTGRSGGAGRRCRLRAPAHPAARLGCHRAELENWREEPLRSLRPAL